MKTKRLSVAIAMLLVAGAFWLWRGRMVHKPGMDLGLKKSGPGQMLNGPTRLAPPDPIRKFRELTPEERVKLARRGPVGG